VIPLAILLCLQDPDRAGLDFYESRIRPLLVEKCYSCHSAEAKKLKGDLRLDTRPGILKVVAPGDPAASLLLRAIRHLDDDLKMPPKERLAAATVADFETWVKRGAPTPSAGALVNKHAPLWSLALPGAPAPPAVRQERWAKTPVDRFILSRLEEKGLEPAPPADRRTLLRRVTYALTGLPPAPEEVDAFLADASPDAYEKVVDRLLESPRYGERWARHWLDVVHFGETHGYDKDKRRLNAWPYRDYVIGALNLDTPYSRFVQEQLAGDVLFPDDPQGIVATGFLAAGPWDFVGHTELPETKTDGLIARYNDRDDMVMSTVSTFLSLTVHCARCHDHKFDPMSQADYYALQAVFAGVDRADRPFDPDPAVHARRRTLEAEARFLSAKAAAITPPEVRELDSRFAELKRRPRASPSNGYHSAIESAPDVAKWVQVDLGRAVALDEIRLVPARPTDFPDTPGFGFPPRYRVEIAEGTAFEALAERDEAGPGDAPVSVAAGGRRVRFVRVTATRLWKRRGDFVFALAELQALAGGENVASGKAVEALDSIEAGRWAKAFLVDGCSSRARLPDAIEQERRALERERKVILETRADPAVRSELQGLARRLEEVEKQLAALPAPQRVYAAAADFAPVGTFRPAGRPRPVHLLVRGDVRRPGSPAAPGALGCVPGPRFELADPDNEGARRAALARWITDPANFLARRSIVNRVWHYHFGRGIVETPNDFGRMGAAPSHPELLDWLALWFKENGESFKKLHRMIVTSATYRQSSRGNAAAARVDSDNRLLWRMNRSRLDAEAFRDSLLAAAGTLDLTMGGPSVQQFFYKDDHSPVYDYARWDPGSPGADRRSVYRFVVRSVPDPFVEAMDGADPSLLTPRRNTTLTALQALAALNDPFVLRQCERFAERVRASGRDPVEEAYRVALGRPPGPDEKSRMADFAARHGLANACRVLVNSNEFAFVD